MTSMNKFTTILVSGYRGAGKDTFYALANNFHNITSWYKHIAGPDKGQRLDDLASGCVSRLAFADMLREEYCREHNVHIMHLHRNKEVYRPRLIEFATAQRKKFGDDYYARAVALNICRNPRDTVIVTDWRFRVEYDRIKTAVELVGGDLITVRITNTAVDAPPLAERTEHALDDFIFDYRLFR